MTQPILTLNDHRPMPQLGLGVWQMPEGRTAEAVGEALRTGYRLIDGAAMYGNEAGMGQAVRASGLPRDEVFVTSKLWNDQQGRDRTLRAFDATMQRLGLDHLDLYLIHWPCPDRGLYVETWKTLIELRDAGRVRSIGVANFLPPHLIRLIDETGVAPALNQIELHPGFNQADLRAENRRIAERLQATPAQVVLAWHLAHGLSAIPKSQDPGRQRGNFGALQVTLSDDDMAAIDALDTGRRTGPDPASFNG